MLEIIALLIFIAITWFFTWIYGSHLVEKGYLASWKELRSDWFLFLIMMLAGTGAANGFIKFVAWLIEGLVILVGL